METNSANVVDGFQNSVRLNEDGLVLTATPGEDLQLETSDGGQVLINGSPVATGGVDSWNGRTGIVVPEANDYTNVPDLSLDDGISLIEFNSGDESVTMQDANNDSVICDGGGHLQLNASVSVDVVAPSFTINGSPISFPVFVDAEVPSTFTTNHAYDLAHAPNPPASLQVFVDDTTLGATGCNVLLVQGVDYTLTNGGTRIQYGSAIITNKIVCWYRR
jgi:hypothetical protein